MLKLLAHSRLPCSACTWAWISGKCSSQPVVPTTTGTWWRRQSRMLPRAMAGVLNSMATSAPTGAAPAFPWSTRSTTRWPFASATCSIALPIFPYPYNAMFMAVLLLAKEGVGTHYLRILRVRPCVSPVHQGPLRETTDGAVPSGGRLWSSCVAPTPEIAGVGTAHAWGGIRMGEYLWRPILSSLADQDPHPRPRIAIHPAVGASRAGAGRVLRDPPVQCRGPVRAGPFREGRDPQ